MGRHSPTPSVGWSRRATSQAECMIPMFTVLQRYRVRLGTVADAAVRAEETLVPRLKAVSGFVAYHLLNTGDSTVAALALFETKPAADSAALLLNEWFRSDWPAFRLLAPDLSVAESLTLAQANGDAVKALPSGSGENGGHAALYGELLSEEAVEAGPPVPRDRRRIGERRLLVVARVPERRAATDRRTIVERRSGSERRGLVAPSQTVVMSERRGRMAPVWRRREVVSG
jgi:hypothetical protein